MVGGFHVYSRRTGVELPPLIPDITASSMAMLTAPSFAPERINLKARLPVGGICRFSHVQISTDPPASTPLRKRRKLSPPENPKNSPL